VSYADFKAKAALRDSERSQFFSSTLCSTVTASAKAVLLNIARTTKPLTNTEVKQAKGHGVHPHGWPRSAIAGQTQRLENLVAGLPASVHQVRTSLSFGPYPAVSLAHARKKRSEAKTLLAKDIDPKEHRDNLARRNATSNSNTLRHIAAQWLEIKKTQVTTAHALDSWRSLELHIFPSLGKVPIHKITAVNAIDAIKPVAAMGSLETVKRLCQRLNEVMTYAVNFGLITANPLAGISSAFQNPAKQHQPTIAPARLPALMKTLSRASIRITTRCLIEWQLHTMVRPGEAAGTRWDEIDMLTTVWTIPAERMKKNKAHAVPLSPHAIELLEVMRPISAQREFVFPSDRNPRTHTHPSAANMALMPMGFDKLLVAHGLRALASTTLNEQGFDLDVIESALAHTGKNEVRNAYNRAQYMERRIPLMNWWSEHIEKSATGNMSLAGTRALSVVGQ
jgi:integrase